MISVLISTMLFFSVFPLQIIFRKISEVKKEEEER